MSGRRVFAVWVALLAGSACGVVVEPVDSAMDEPAVPITIELAAVQAAESGLIVFRFTNRSSSAVDYTVCFERLERSVSGFWEVVPDFERACRVGSALLAPGSSALQPLRSRGGLVAGRYRVWIDLFLEGREPLLVVSPVFDVAPA